MGGSDIGSHKRICLRQIRDAHIRDLKSIFVPQKEVLKWAKKYRFWAL